MSLTPTEQALWANSITRQCLLEADGDVDAALMAAEYLLATQPIPLSVDAQGHEHRGEGEGGGQFVKKNGEGLPYIPSELIYKGTSDLTLYRASDEDDVNHDSTSFSEDRAVAEFYLNNPGYGGENIYRTKVKIDNKRVLDFTDVEDPVKTLASFLGEEMPNGRGIDELVPIFNGELRNKGIHWVLVPESNPSGTVTWIHIGGGADDPELKKLKKSANLSVYLSHDIHNREAQGILNRSLKAVPLSVDSSGHEHKGKGEGGGQFVSTRKAEALESDVVGKWSKVPIEIVESPSTLPNGVNSSVHIKGKSERVYGGEHAFPDTAGYLDLTKTSDGWRGMKVDVSKDFQLKGLAFDLALVAVNKVGPFKTSAVFSEHGKKFMAGLVKRGWADELDGGDYLIHFKGVAKDNDKLLSINAYLSHDIHNREAQGVLNRSLKAVRGLSAAARRDLASALKSPIGSGEAILAFVDRYRLQLARLLNTTQLASLLEGAREVAEKVPPLGTVPIEGLPIAEQERIAATRATTPPPTPPFTPPPPPAGSPEGIHYPTIDEAVKHLAEKNVLTRPQYDALDAASRAKAFTVANVAAEETLTKIRDSLAENVKEGVDYETWKGKVLQDVEQGTFMSENHLCFLPETIVEGAVVAASKIWYSGPIAEIETNDGRRLRVTIHHPILTPFGWKDAGSLKKGDYLICYGDPVKPLSSRTGVGVRTNTSKLPQRRAVYDNNIPSSVKDVFKTILVERSSGVYCVSPVSPLDFHGDGIFTQGNVYRVRSDWWSRSANNESNVSKTLRQRVLMERRIPTPDGSSSGGLSLLTPLLNTALAPANRINRIFGSQSSGFLSSTITSVSVPHGTLLLGSAAYVDPVVFKATSKSNGADVELASELPKRLPVLVTTNRVRNIKIIRFSGHVYDLQTAPGWIVSQGIVSGNSTVFRTNVQGAFSDGQMSVLSHPLVRSGFPYSAYDAIHDDRARENHLALEKLGIGGTNIYRNDDPVFQLFRPPWDYNDRCGWTPITVHQASERGVSEAQEWLKTGVEPADKAYVAMPAFQPPEGFKRAVSSAPLSIQLSMQPMSAFSHEDHTQPTYHTVTLSIDPEEHPRNTSNQYLDKYTIVEAANEPEIAEALRESLPEEQRWKLDRAIMHLQMGGTIHHPSEPPGLGVDISGDIPDEDWSRYAEQLTVREAWTGRSNHCAECRKCADRATKLVRKGSADLDEVDKELETAGATDAEMRSISRMRHRAKLEQEKPEVLDDLYEDVIEAIQRRLDEVSAEKEPEQPEEPTKSIASILLSVGEGVDRNQLIAEVLVHLFGKDAHNEVLKLFSMEDNDSDQALSIMLATPKVTRRYGKKPGPGWRPGGMSSRGVQIWLWGAGPSGGSTTPTPMPSAPPTPTPAPSPPPAPVAPSSTIPPIAPPRIGGKRPTNAAVAAATHAHFMAKIIAGIPLSASEKTTLSTRLNIMNSRQLQSLHTALGGSGPLANAKATVAAVKAILTAAAAPTTTPVSTPPVTPAPTPIPVSSPAPVVPAPPPLAPTPAPTPPAPPKPSPAASAAAAVKALKNAPNNLPVVPMKDETTWTTGKAEAGTLNGVDFAPAPPKFWEKVKDVDVKEPPSLKPVDRVSIMIQEPDGRIWIVQPTNEYGGRKHTMPGGGVEKGLTDQQNALKEAWEETGLQVEITGYAGDFEDSNNSKNGRLYIARRIGGAPWGAKVESHIINQKTGKPDAESETVMLVTPEKAAQLLHRTDDLAQLAVVNPISINTNPKKNLIAKIFSAVQPKAKEYESKKLAANESPGDAVLHAVQEMHGFNEKPSVVNKTDFDALMAKGDHIELLRGIASRPPSSHHAQTTLTPREMAEQFKTGDHFPGHGMFGVGTYADSTKGHRNVAAGSYSSGGTIMRIALPKNAKIVKFTELKSVVNSYPSGYEAPSGKSETDYWRGIHAALAGYDAIHVDGDGYGKGYYVILNRGILTVQDKAPPKDYVLS